MGDILREPPGFGVDVPESLRQRHPLPLGVPAARPGHTDVAHVFLSWAEILERVGHV